MKYKKIRNWTQILAGLLFISSPARSQSIDILSESMFHGGYNAVAASGNYAFCSADGHLLSISFADSASPQMIAIHHFQSAAAAFLQGNYIYFSGSMFQGDMSIVDISNSSNPHVLSALAVDDEGSTDIFVEGDYAYVTCYNNQVAIINISNRSNPFVESRLNTDLSTYGVAKLGNYLFVAEYDSGLVVNVADPANPFICGSINPHLYAWNSFDHIVASGNYCYISSTEGGVFIFDISNPASPVFLSSIWPDSNRITTIAINGNDIYAVSPYRALYTIDVSNPLAPVVLNRFSQENEIFSDIAISGSRLFLSGELPPGNHYYSDYGFVEMLDISQPSQPVLLSMQRASPVNPREVGLCGNYAIVGANGAYIWDISDPTDPQKIGEFSRFISNLQVVGNMAYALSEVFPDSSKFLAIDLANPESLNVIGQITIPGYPNDLAIGPNHAYVMSGSGIYIIDISNPHLPEIIGLFGDAGTSSQVIYNDHYLYTLSGNLGIFDVNDPENPLRLCNYQPPHEGADFYVAGNYVFITGWYNPPIDLFKGVMVIDASDKSNPVLVSTFATEDVPTDICVGANHAFILEGYAFSSIEAVDISNLESPSIVARQDSITDGHMMIVRDNKIYLGGLTFMILQFNSPTFIKGPDDQLPQIAGLECYPNPSNSSFNFKYDLSFASEVELTIFDISGRKVKSISDGYQGSGVHRIGWVTEGLSSGIYFYRIKAGDYIETKKMVLLK
jgi:hypothetical protein